MNVYAINPELIREDRFPYLLNILKVKRIISFIEYVPPILESLLIHKTDLIYKGSNVDEFEKFVNQSIRQAVYKFNAEMCTPKPNMGTWNREFFIHDIYKDSKAHNPIYNLEYCNDENVLVLINYDTENYYEQFINHSLNILKKHATNLHYENRLCFILFNEGEEYKLTHYFVRTNVYSNGEFKSLVRYLPTEYDSDINLKVGKSYSVFYLPPSWKIPREKVFKKGLVYDPLISYINLKSKELYPNIRKDSDILDFFLKYSPLNNGF